MAGRASKRRGPLRRLFWWLLALAPFAFTAAMAIWALSFSPFAQPFVARTAPEVARAIEVALAREVTPDWIRRELSAALDAGDLDRARLVRDVALDQGRPIPAPLPERLAALEEAETGVWNTTALCARCAVDIAQCPRIDLMAACGVPFELSPAGDANALRRAGVAWWRGQEIDRLDAGLAVAGLGATALVVVSGGPSLTVKAGTGVLRLARRLGTLTAGFAADLGRLADIGLRPGRIPAYAIGRAPLEEVADMSRVAGLAAVAADVGRIANRTSLTETVLLLRHVDSAEDAARMARVAAAVGPETRRGFEVLGKARMFRALVRLSRLAAGAALLIYALALQVCLFLAERLGRATLRAVREVLRGG